MQNGHAARLIRCEGGGRVCHNQSVGVAQQLPKLVGFGRKRLGERSGRLLLNHRIRIAQTFRDHWQRGGRIEPAHDRCGSEAIDSITVAQQWPCTACSDSRGIVATSASAAVSRISGTGLASIALASATPRSSPACARASTIDMRTMKSLS